MRTLALILLTAAILACILLVFNSAQAGIGVGGAIVSNTSWTKANSPYSLSSLITVNEGAILTVEAGTTINMNGFSLQVNGKLEAIGSSRDPIQFIGGRIFFHNGTIQNSILTSTSLSIGGDAVISGNTITGSSSTETGVDCGSSTVISGNQISGWGTGIRTEAGFNFYVDGKPVIQENVISKNSIGISVDLFLRDFIGQNWPSIMNNTLSDNSQFGLNINATGPNVAEISQRRYPWMLDSIVLSSNNFVGNAKNLGVPAGMGLNALSNWWGTTDLTAINQTFSGYVNYVPYLLGPYNGQINSVSPTLPPAKISGLQIGTPYRAPDGLTVTLNNLIVLDKPGSYQYIINYTLKNENSDSKIMEGSWRLSYISPAYNGSIQTIWQNGEFNDLFPGDLRSRSYVFEDLKNSTYNLLEYSGANVGSNLGSLQWAVDVSNAVSSLTQPGNASPVPTLVPGNSSTTPNPPNSALDLASLEVPLLLVIIVFLLGVIVVLLIKRRPNTPAHKTELS